MNLELYRVFYHVAQAGSISGGARDLYISQSAVSQSIKQLEDQLGGRVFTRTPKGIELTREGSVLFAHIKQAYSLISTGEQRFWDLLNLVTGQFHIGASDTLCKHYLLPYLSRYREHYPQVRIHITNRTTRETLSLLKAGRVDIGLINLPIESDEQLVIQETRLIQDCFIVGEKYRHLTQSPLSLAEIAIQPLLLLEEESNTRRSLNTYAQSLGVQIRPEIELGSLDLLVEFARQGFGVAYVVRQYVERELQTGQVWAIPWSDPSPPRGVGVVSLQGVPLPVAALRFIDLLQEDQG